MIRLISCLDIKNNLVVKGKKFKKIKIINKPYFLCLKYEKYKISELILLDITANYTKKSISNYIIKKIAKKICIPICIGGGIKSINDVNYLLKIGADRIILNSFCFENIQMIKFISKFYGTQSFIIAIDYKMINNKIIIFKNSGFVKININFFDWIIIIKKIGVSEIVLTSIDNDGVKKGYDVNTIFLVKKYFQISLIASGGIGSISDIYYLYKYCNVKNYLIASLFHNSYLIPMYFKKYLKFINVL